MKLRKGLITLIILLSSFIIFPVSSYGEDICFDETTAGQIVVELEKSKIIEQENALLEQGSQELERQVGLLKQIIELKDKQLQVEDQALTRYVDLIKQQQQICDEEIKRAKPSFFEKVGNIATGAIIGIIIGIFVL
jgi:hypothetical protein